MSSSDRELRDALEAVQQENKSLRGLVAELSAFNPEELWSRIAELENQNGELRLRLDQADKVREKWDARTKRLKHELGIARTEQDRLRSLLENERLSKR